jgi:hypothetical protein
VTARRKALADLDQITASLRDRTDELDRRLRALYRDVFPRRT